MLVCYAAGALIALAFAPFQFWPILFLSIPVFFSLLDASKTPRHAMARGFAFGYGYFMAGTWWIANALTVDMAKFGWLIPVCVLGLSAVAALFFALLGWLYHRIKSPHLFTNILRFIALWVAIEYLRSIGIFGFPWNLAGYAALASIEVAQLASIIGVFGLSVLVIAVSILPVLTLKHDTRHMRIAGIVVPLLMMSAAYGYGAQRLPESAPLTETTVRIMQPNIPQNIKGSDQWLAKSLDVLSELARGDNGSALTPADFTVWPETAYPLPIRGNRITLLTPASGTLITGALRVEGESAQVRIYNSVAAIDSSGLLLAAYDKHQLVPFGEFVPLRSVLPLDKITPGDLDFSRGTGAQTILLRDLPAFSPLICYEVIFPWMAVNKTNRPAWLVNVTNDGWYGDSPGPYQHLAMARMRSIEQGLPLVRAANSGVSAFIDPYGRIITKLALDTRGTLNARLPAPLTVTLYARYGECVAILAAILILAASLLPKTVRKNK